MAAQMPGHETRSASGAFPKLNRSNTVMTIPQIASFRDKLRLLGKRIEATLPKNEWCCGLGFGFPGDARGCKVSEPILRAEPETDAA
jgi:hypothetical protein